MEWQPIETAPKEIVVEYSDIQRFGRHVLLWDGSTPYPYRGRWWQAKNGASNWLADGGMAAHPTHWMPLPTPPVPHPA
jgi:hypothetical protein